NLVTDREGVGAAVLIRSAEVVAGHELVYARRKVSAPLTPLAQARLVAGPGKVGQALGLDRRLNHHPVIHPGPLELHLGAKRPRLLSGPRVGIDYAAPEHRLAPWRFADAESRAITAPKTLAALPELSPPTPARGLRPEPG
ncbi:MAG TPA: DNA-3-methyladenine glycosylase, partial [Myxococcota bacterium]|nr:DNA-3-methyladenine glycosylase [Myxococcota bacterium]